MNEVWNLEPIYKGFSDPAFARDYESLKALVQELKTFSDGLEGMEPLAGLTRGIALAEELTRLVEKLAEYARHPGPGGRFPDGPDYGSVLRHRRPSGCLLPVGQQP